MIRDKKIDKICLWFISLAAVLTILLTGGCFLFAFPEKEEAAAENYISTEYADQLFDDSYVHEIDIQLPQVNWDYMVKNAEDEQYVLCNAVIDGEKVENIAIRPKGNSSLVAIKSQGSDRFSFKIEFDHYRKNNTYHGLDKLSLNNLGQDVSCMKDYLSYQMMNEIGIPAPLTSYAQVKLNGKDFGLYLAVEAIEDSFAFRNYGTNYGNLYKPEPFAIETVTPSAFMSTKESPFNLDYTSCGPGDRADILGDVVKIPFQYAFGELMEVSALNYVGEDEERYQIFYDSSVFDLTKDDKKSLIQALKKLNSREHPQDAIELEDVINYFIVHNFVNNYDGYTGVFVHNYYLRECDGKISMIPWDYNLGFGIFTFRSAVQSIMGLDSPYQVEPEVGNAMDDSTGMVNYPIDTPTFTVEVEDRPLLAAVLKDETSLKKYHENYAQFLDHFFAGGRFEEMYQRTWENIAPYIAKGQTFYSFEQFKTASEAVHDYCILREESIRRQLEGSLPATKEGQSSDYKNLVDASNLNLASSVTFDSLVFGIRSEDVIEILDAIAGENEHNSAGVGKTISEATENPKEIGNILLRVLTSSRLIKNGIRSALEGPVLLLLSLIILLPVRKKVKKYQRKKMWSKNERKGKKNAV